MESIFTTETPATTNAADGAPGLTLGTLFQPTVDGAIFGNRWYFPATLPAGTVSAQLWTWTSDAAGTLVGSTTFASPTAGTWSDALYASPISVTAGTYYVASIWTPDRYVASLNFFTFGGVTSPNGLLVAPQSDNVTPRRNGKFAAGATPAYPTISSNEPCYFVDVLFSVPTSPTVVIPPTAAHRAGSW